MLDRPILWVTLTIEANRSHSVSDQKIRRVLLRAYAQVSPRGRAAVPRLAGVFEHNIVRIEKTPFESAACAATHGFCQNTDQVCSAITADICVATVSAGEALLHAASSRRFNCCANTTTALPPSPRSPRKIQRPLAESSCLRGFEF
jgi:hypothetical protein